MRVMDFKYTVLPKPTISPPPASSTPNYFFSFFFLNFFASNSSIQNWILFKMFLRWKQRRRLLTRSIVDDQCSHVLVPYGGLSGVSCPMGWRWWWSCRWCRWCRIIEPESRATSLKIGGIVSKTELEYHILDYEQKPDQNFVFSWLLLSQC